MQFRKVSLANIETYYRLHHRLQHWCPDLQSIRERAAGSQRIGNYLARSRVEPDPRSVTQGRNKHAPRDTLEKGPSRHLRRRRRQASGFPQRDVMLLGSEWLCIDVKCTYLADTPYKARRTTQATRRRQKVCQRIRFQFFFTSVGLFDGVHSLPAPFGLVRRSLYRVSASYTPITSLRS
jgi:hypothetical protein